MIKNEYFKPMQFHTDHAGAKVIEIDLAKMREDEEMIWDHIDEDREPDLAIVAETIFDDYNATRENPNLEKAYYIECIRNNQDAPKGSGTALLNSIIEQFSSPNTIFCLYASPLTNNRRSYTAQEKAVFLPKLMAVYERLGFESAKSEKQVMHRY